jgi:hypothetical protein
MPKKPPRHGKRWTQTNVNRLRKLSGQKASTKRIANELGRSAVAVRSKASEIGVSLKPKDRGHPKTVRLGYVPAKPPVKLTRKPKGKK